MKKLLILLMVMSCTACSALPAEERAFAVALMIEREGDTWRVHGRIPTYQTGGGYRTVSGEGATLSAALTDLDAASPMHLHLSQLRLVVLAEALGAEAAEILRTLSDRVDVRPDCAAAVTDAAPDAFMEALTPSTGARLSKALDVLLDTRAAQGQILYTTLAEAVRMGTRQSPVLPRVTLSGKEVDLSGGYGLQENGLTPIAPEEMMLLSLLLGEAKELTLDVSGGTAKVRDISSKALLVDRRTAAVTVTLTAIASPLPAESLEAQLAQDCLTLLARLSADGCDVLGLGRQAILGAVDRSAWLAVDWPQRLASLPWSVSVRVNGPA